MSERMIIIGSIVVLALAVIGGGIAIWSLSGTLAEKEKLRKKIEDDVKVAQKKQKDLEDTKDAKGNVVDGLRTQARKQEEEIKTGKERVPDLDENEFDTFAEKIDELRKLSSTTVKNAKWAAAGRSGAAGAVPSTMFKAKYDISAQGGFFNLLRLLNMVETNKRFINVDSFAITSGSQSTEKGGLAVREMKLTVSTYLRKVTKRPDEVAPPKPTEEKVQTSTPLPE